MYHLSHVRCHVSGFMCHMSHVTSHLSPIPTATATASDPTPANSPAMQSRKVCKKLKPKTKTLFQNLKNH